MFVVIGQGGGEQYDSFASAAMEQDGSVILAGYSSSACGTVKLDADGNVLWTWQVQCQLSSRVTRFLLPGTRHGLQGSRQIHVYM